MRYNETTDQIEDAKEKEAWKVTIVATVAFILIGLTIWFTGFGGKY